MIEKENMKLFI